MRELLGIAVLICLNLTIVAGFHLANKPPLSPKKVTKHKGITIEEHNFNSTISDYYWSRRDIHTLGNVGVGGFFHAAVAPLATKLIDVFAYNGADVRSLVAHDLRKKMNKRGVRIADLCCGVGISTRQLESAFPDAELIIGYDTSPEMIKKANAISNHKQSIRKLLPRLKWWLQSVLQTIFSRQEKKEWL